MIRRWLRNSASLKCIKRTEVLNKIDHTYSHRTPLPQILHGNIVIPSNRHVTQSIIYR